MMISSLQPAIGPGLDYGKAFYPNPPSHDFLAWLAVAEALRRHHNASGPLKVKFGKYKGQLGLLDFAHFALRLGKAFPCSFTKERSDQMLENVLRPAINMIGAVEESAVDLEHLDINAIANHVEYDYHMKTAVDFSRAGVVMPYWQPPKWAFDEADQFLQGSRPVIITLREAPHDPDRNSIVEEWLEFAEGISSDFDVLFVRDTQNAYVELPGFRICPRASENAYFRAALYHRAYVNMMVNNGPSMWCVFSNCPYLVFKMIISSNGNWTTQVREMWDHLTDGQSYPWANRFQRLIWADDKAEILRWAFDKFIKEEALR